MKESSSSEIAEMIQQVVCEAVESQNHTKCLNRLILLEDSEDYEEFLSMALFENEKRSVKVVSSVLEYVRRQSYCNFLGIVFSHVLENPKRFLKLQAFIMKIVLNWDCSNRDETRPLEETLECDIECLSFLLPIVGIHLQQTFPSQLETMFRNVRDMVLLESLPRMSRSRLLDLLLLKTSGWKPKSNVPSEFNFPMTIANGHSSVVGSIFQEEKLARPASVSSRSSVALHEMATTYGNASREKWFGTPVIPERKLQKENKDEVLLSPSAFGPDEEDFPPLKSSFPITPVLPVVESNSTLQTMAPKASEHPQPPQSWLPLASKNDVPSTFHAYVPPLSSYFQEKRDSKSKPTSSESLSSVSNTLKDDRKNFNGARPKVKFDKESSVSSSSFPERNGIQPAHIPPVKLVQRKECSQTLGSDLISEKASDVKRPAEKSFQRPLAAEVRKPASPVVQKKVTSPVDARKHLPNQNRQTIPPAIVKSLIKTKIEDGGDDEDLIVERCEEANKGGKKKTKWSPLSPSNAINHIPSKSALLAKPPAVTTRKINASEHPFLSSQRICSICGETDHKANACPKTRSVYMNQEC